MIIIVTLVVLIVLGLVWWRARATERTAQLQDFENSRLALVMLSKGTSPFLVDVRVLDMHGNPLSGARIDIRNNSGGNAGTSDKSGYAKIQVAERGIEQILLDGQSVMNRPNAYELGYPSVEQGLLVLIVKKDPFGVPQKR